MNLVVLWLQVWSIPLFHLSSTLVPPLHTHTRTHAAVCILPYSWLNIWCTSFRQPLPILVPPFSPDLNLLLLNLLSLCFLSSAQPFNSDIWSGGSLPSPGGMSVVIYLFILSLIYLILFVPPITFQCSPNSNSYVRTHWFSGMNSKRI